MSNNDNLAPRGPHTSDDEERTASTSPLSTAARENAIPHRTQFFGASEYDQDLALLAEKREQEMTFKHAFIGDLCLIMYSLGYSGTIIMEGYGMALLTYFFSVEPFNAKYGVFDTTTGKYELAYKWKALLPLLSQLGAIFGVVLTSFFVNWVGYKHTVLFMLILCAAFGFVPFFANNVVILAIGCLVQGIPWGVFQVASPAYSSEIASLRMRPILTTWNNLCWIIGQLLASAVAFGFHRLQNEWAYRVPFALNWVFIAFLFVAIFVAPESPYWYLQKNRVEDAHNAIKKLVRKGSEERTQEKLALMQHAICHEMKHVADNQTRWQRISAMFRGTDRRRTEITCNTWMIQALCGSSLIGWAPKLFESVGMASDKALAMNIALPCAGIVGTIASWWLMQKMGRRRIFFWGLISMAIMLSVCGAASLATTLESVSAAGAILVVYTAVYDLTIGPICYSIVSDIPSVRLRTQTIALARGLYLAANLFNMFLTPKMLGMDSKSWRWGAKTGFLYAGFCGLGALYTFYRIPETKDISVRGLSILFNEKVKARKFSATKAAELEKSPGAAASMTSISDNTVSVLDQAVEPKIASPARAASAKNNN
ncbi:sugar transporter [Neurospora intermedia]|uniref:Sugar transporter n=1 Tax=Neurospora intermedia TaxID=5142 RepID=A0ABR3DMM7_NEUIN